MATADNQCVQHGGYPKQGSHISVSLSKTKLVVHRVTFVLCLSVFAHRVEPRRHELNKLVAMECCGVALSDWQGLVSALLLYAIIMQKMW